MEQLPDQLVEELFSQITIVSNKTGDLKDHIVDRKKALLQELREGRYFDRLLDGRFLYVGSAWDIEVPFYLGFKKIDLIDPCFLLIHHVVNVKRAIERYGMIQSSEEKSDGTIVISATIGNVSGYEIILHPYVVPDPYITEFYGKRIRKEVRDRIPDWEYTVLFSFLSQTTNWLLDTTVLNGMCHGGYACVNGIPDKFLEHIPQYVFERMPGYIWEYTTPLWEKLGFKQIKVRAMGKTMLAQKL